MALVLTIILNNRKMKNNIQVDSGLKIKEMINILCENNILPYLQEDNYRVKSIRQGKFINSIHTFEEANIYTGDILDITI